MSKARFNGTCQCGHEFPAGASVRWDRVDGKLVTIECPHCHPEIHGTEDAPKASIETRVRLQRVRFIKPDGSFTTTDALFDGEPPADSPFEAGQVFPLVGPLGKVAVGDLLEVYGNFQKDGKYGWQLVVQRFCAVVAGTDQALRAFLSKFPQVGPRRAELILQKLGSREAVIHALEHEPERLTVVPGITAARAKEIGQAFVDLSDLRASAMFLAGLTLGEQLTAQILDEYGADAKAVVVEDPYQLMDLPGVGFKRADDIAKKLNISRDDPRRLAAATLHILQQVEDDGHTWSGINDLMSVG